MEDPFLIPPTRPLLQQLKEEENGEGEDNYKNNNNDDDEPINPIDLPSAPILHHSLFLDPNFDPSDFLLTRRHTALDDLRSELRAYLATLRTSLVEVINTEYEAFIGLSLGLRQASVASSLATIRKPVTSIRTEVTKVKTELEGMREEMETVLEERNQVRESKALLRRLLGVEESVEKVEGLLRLGEGTSKGDELDRILTSPAKRLERIAGEYNQMLYLVDKAGDMPFVRSLDTRIARITSTLHLDLSQLLTALLSPPSPSSSTTTSTQSLTLDLKTKRESLTTLLRTYASLNLTTTAEDLIRKIIVKPFVIKTIHREVLTSPMSPSTPITPLAGFSTPSTFSNQQDQDSSNVVENDKNTIPLAYVIEPIGSKGGNDGIVVGREVEALAELYNKLLNFISKECGLLLDITERSLALPTINTTNNNSGSSSGLFAMSIAASEDATTATTIKKAKANSSGYEVLTNVIWEEIGNRLMAELGHVIFAAGRPSLFHQNYSITMAFISKLESLSPSIPYLESFRSHPTYQTFTKRFQLPVYFQLRFKEIVYSVESTLESGNSANGIIFLLGESEAIWKAIAICWSQDVYLTELAGKFWRLTLQLLSRYKLWLNSVIPKYQNSPNGLAAPGGRNSFDSNRSSTPIPSRPTTPLPSSTSNSTGGAQSEGENDESILRQLTVLISDASLMEKKVNQLFEDKIRDLLPYEDDVPTNESSGSVLKESLSALTNPFIPTLSSQVTLILSKRCSESLKLVRHVASQVRASTKKGTLTEPSYFIPNIFKELKVYLNGPGRVLEEDLRKEWSKIVVDDVATKYAAILASQKKTEDGLRWLKKGKGTTLSFFGRATSSTTASTTEDDDGKVKLQMQLDVNALAKDAISFGVDVDNSVAFEGLRSLVVTATVNSESGVVEGGNEVKI